MTFKNFAILLPACFLACAHPNPLFYQLYKILYLNFPPQCFNISFFFSLENTRLFINVFILQITAYVTLTEAFSDPWCKATALALNIYLVFYHTVWLPCWLSGKESVCKAGAAGDMGSIPGVGRSLAGGHGNPLQYSCLENPMDREAWQAAVHRVTQHWKWPSNLACTHVHLVLWLLI